MVDKDKKREQDRERQRRKRERDRAHKERCGAEPIAFEMYKGTRHCMEELMKAGGFTEKGELFTMLVHGVHRELKRDPSRFKELIKV